MRSATTWARRVVTGGMLACAPAASGAQVSDGAGLVSVSGHSLAVSCMGASTDLPPVIFENGLGEDYATWALVQPAIAEVTRACAYDRLGAGASDPVPESDTRTPFEQAATLRTLMSEIGIEPPVVLVGHSIAGLILLAYPHLYPAEVGGLVFVDASHPTQWQRFLEVDPDAGDPLAVAGRERIDRGAAATELAAVGRFPDLPLVVIHQARPTESPMRPIWVELQQDHASRSDVSRLVPATDSGHYVQLDQPELVIEAIEWVLQRHAAR